ncbi:unnamed protein product [Sphagnum compactum]
MKKVTGSSHRLARMRSKNRSGFNNEQASETSFRLMPVSHFRAFIQCMFCIGTLILGFRLTTESSFLTASFQNPDYSFTSISARTDSSASTGTESQFDRQLRREFANGSKGSRLAYNGTIVHSSGGVRVDVGRHAILIRPWPHPDPFEVLHAHHLIKRVQLEQRQLYGSKESKPIIAITTTFVRTFQAVHLTGLLHTLSVIPVPVTWIVMEAGGVTNETAHFLSIAHVHRLLHLGFDIPMPAGLNERSNLEAQMRVEGLRYVQKEKLEGVVVFADESNIHSLEFFTEAQKVDWVGAVSVGLLGFAGFEESPQSGIVHVHDGRVEARGNHILLAARQAAAAPRFEPQVQGPSCDSNGNLVGWHIFDPLPLESKVHKGMRAAQNRRLEWANFVLNARAVWKTEGNQPEWIRSWDEWASPEDGSTPDIKAIVRSDQWVKVLGDCGRKVLLWWLRAEARADSKHPNKWILDESLEIIVPAKSTPWPRRPVQRAAPPPPAPAGGTGTKHGAGSRVSSGKVRRPKRKQDQTNVS